jgi:hypothetical protein
MTDNSEMVTVFRSADLTARDDAEEISQILAAEGIESSVVDDRTAGVIAGSVEVRVAAALADRVDAIVAAAQVEGDMADTDPSSVLDPVTIFRSAGTNVEAQAIAIEGMLRANGIQTIRVGAPSIPSLPFEIRVSKEQVERAQQLISEAESFGGAAADEEEQSGEAS